ncbi:MAG TPA: J domain-containing protein [Armatimonadota bacterium]|nr:J domain-containing protein [Armatimonadota bacterium]
MSLPHRIWRIARRRVMRGLGLEQGASFRGPRDAARDELEEFLRRPEPPPAGGRTYHTHRGPRTEAASGATSERPRAGTPPHPFAAEYGVLGIPAGSDLQAVRRAWRRLVRETHPDRFAGDPPAQRRAAERLRRVNEAYHRLREHLEAR